MPPSHYLRGLPCYQDSYGIWWVLSHMTLTYRQDLSDPSQVQCYPRTEVYRAVTQADLDEESQGQGA